MLYRELILQIDKMKTHKSRELKEWAISKRDEDALCDFKKRLVTVCTVAEP